MSNVPFPYRMARPPVKLRKARLDNIALVPASLLPFQERYKTIARTLPAGSVLICTPGSDKQRKALESVASTASWK